MTNLSGTSLDGDTSRQSRREGRRKEEGESGTSSVEVEQLGGRGVGFETGEPLEKGTELRVW